MPNINDIKDIPEGVYPLPTINANNEAIRQILSNVSGFIGVRLYAPDSQVLEDGVASAVIFPETNVYDGSHNPVFDTLGFYNPAQPTRLTIPAGMSGYYHLIGRVHFGADATNRAKRTIMYKRNGNPGNYTSFPVEIGDGIKFECNTLTFLNEGDYIELFADPGVSYDAGIYDSQLMMEFRGN
jgi:hypothetical protein